MILQSTTAAVAIALVLPGPVAAQAQDVDAWTFERQITWPVGNINAAPAYALGLSGQGVKVGVLDTGIDLRHPEFNGRFAGGYDFMQGRPMEIGQNFDSDDHGTHVGGIIAANRDGVGMHGIAYRADLYATTADGSATSWNDAFSASWRYLADQGVSIINNSIGINNCVDETVAPPCNVTDYTPGDFAADNPDMVDALRHAVERDVLMVFATGNEAQPAPDALAGMPYWLPELQDNWLAVGAVDINNQIADFSNRCGVAADWCLVAPGVQVYSTVPLGTGGPFHADYKLMDGTSMATPVVSGVAALVKEAFPFFTAYDLQQALLTTATDMGDRETFGWGMVNAGKAVQGYGRFVNDVVLDTAGFDATFGNDIDGNGGLAKTGAGTLSLNGQNTYRGGTFVAGGSLVLNGSVASQVGVGTGGTLRGTGTISAPLSVAGRLAPGNSPGTLTVAGPVTLSTASTSLFDIDGTGTGSGAGNYSRLIATGPSGTIEVGGALAPTLRGITGSATNTYIAPLGSRYDIIQASAGLSGTFTTLAQPDAAAMARATRFDTLYSAQGVALAVTPLAYGDLTANGIDLSRNEAAVGAALDAVRPSAGARAGALFSGLYDTRAGDLADALGQLTGEIHASQRLMQAERAGMMRDTIADRIRGAFATPAEAPDRASVWTSAYGGWGSGDGNGAARFDWNSANALFGVDAPVGGMTRIGLAGGFGRSSGEIDAYRAEARTTHYDVAIYGGTQFGQVELNYGAAHSWSDVRTSRNPRFGAFNETLSASYDMNATQVFGEVGYHALLGQLALNPFLSGAYLNFEDPSFVERGGSAALTGQVAGDDLGLTVLGLRLSHRFDLGGGKLTAKGMIGWQHAYGTTGSSVASGIAGGASFEFAGVPVARDALRLDLGADYAVSDRLTAGVAYRGALSGETTSSSLRGNLKLSF